MVEGINNVNISDDKSSNNIKSLNNTDKNKSWHILEEKPVSDDIDPKTTLYDINMFGFRVNYIDKESNWIKV